LFIAVDVPADVKAAIEAASAPSRGLIPGARWTQPSGWHVTLKFLGWTAVRLVDEIGSAVREVASAAAPFDSASAALGAFPNARHARVLWAGLADPDGRFAALAGALDERLSELVAPEGRPYMPHLTLARLTPPRNLAEFAPSLLETPVDQRPFRVRELVLYRSHLARAGATYEPLEVAALGD
jgi:2'-5' RNA ligase